MEEVSIDLKEKVLQRVEEITKAVHNTFGLNKESFPIPNIVYNLQSRRFAAKAFSTKHLIRINPYFLNRNVDDFIQRTVPHEIVHLVVRKLYGWGSIELNGLYRRVTPHGTRWKEIMRKLGLESTIYHSYSCPPRKRYKRYLHLYICSKCEHKCNYSSRTHNRIQKAGEKYWSCHCGGDAKYIETYSI